MKYPHAHKLLPSPHYFVTVVVQRRLYSIERAAKRTNQHTQKFGGQQFACKVATDSNSQAWVKAAHPGSSLIVLVCAQFKLSLLFCSTKRKGNKDGIWAMIGTVSEFVLGVDITDTESLKMPENPLTDFNNDVWSNYDGW
jgi:hypothetical protein